MKTKTIVKNLVRGLGGLALFCIGACAGEVTEEPLAEKGEALVGVDTFLYLRCNATGWGVETKNRLLPTSDPAVFELTYAVDQPWMLGAGDQCLVTETNQKDGWGTTQKFYTTRTTTTVTVPNGAPLQLGTANFSVIYPTLGSYKFRVNWRNGGFLISSATSAPQPSTFKKIDKVAVINYDPTLSNGQKLTATRGWETAAALSAQYAADMATASHGAINYQIVDFKTVNAFPKKLDGFTYGETDYLYCADHDTAPAACHQPDGVDYVKIFTENNICSRVESGEISEVWLFGGPFFGYAESTMAGNGAYTVNSGPIDYPCGKKFITMGFSYHVSVTNMLHDFGHRTQSIMDRVEALQPLGSPRPYSQFAAVDIYSPGGAGCGTTHIPANGTIDYEYDNARTVQSSCANWDNFPNAPGTSSAISCTAWGCNEHGYQMWRLSHFPHNEGVSSGYQNDWWKYLVDYNTYVP